jgi:hypothetical protein
MLGAPGAEWGRGIVFLPFFWSCRLHVIGHLLCGCSPSPCYRYSPLPRLWHFAGHLYCICLAIFLILFETFIHTTISIPNTILRPDNIMAVLSDVPGLQVQVVVQNQPLNEYRDRAAKPSGKTVERYVEAQSGKHFEIRYMFEEQFPTDRPLSMIVTIDGKVVDEPLIRTHEILDPDGHISYGPILRSDSGCEVRKYQFLSIDISK